MRFFIVLRLDLLANRLGLTDFLDQADLRHLVAEILATVVYWIVVLLGLEAGGVLLELEPLTRAAQTILGFGPRLAVAAIMLVAATTAARLSSLATERVAARARFPAARGLARAVRVLIVFFGLVMALEHLRIATPLLIGGVQILLAGVVFGVALAFGLGCKDMARDAAVRWFRPVITSTGSDDDDDDS